jgi:hypothetical protein
MKHVVGSLLVAIRLFANVAIAPSLSLAQCCGSEQCAGDLNCDGQVTVDELIVAVNNALQSCAAPVSADQACTDLAIASCTKLDQCVFNGTVRRCEHLPPAPEASLHGALGRRRHREQSERRRRVRQPTAIVVV